LQPWEALSCGSRKNAPRGLRRDAVLFSNIERQQVSSRAEFKSCMTSSDV